MSKFSEAVGPFVVAVFTLIIGWFWCISVLYGAFLVGGQCSAGKAPHEDLMSKF